MIRLIASVIFLAALPISASAHAVGIEVKLKGETVSVEGYFDDDSPAVDARITVVDESNVVVIEGKTDAKGVWSFPMPKPGKYLVRLEDGAGHAAKTTITVPPRSGESRAEQEQLNEVSISEGPTRSMFTGPMRWILAGLGICLIASVTIALNWFGRRKRKEL